MLPFRIKMSEVTLAKKLRANEIYLHHYRYELTAKQWEFIVRNVHWQTNRLFVHFRDNEKYPYTYWTFRNHLSRRADLFPPGRISKQFTNFEKAWIEKHIDHLRTLGWERVYKIMYSDVLESDRGFSKPKIKAIFRNLWEELLIELK